MTTNKPGIKIYEPSEKGVTAMRKASFRNTGPDRYVRLSDYEALQAECEKLRKDAERYRWLTAANSGPIGIVIYDEDGGADISGPQAGGIIDAAMKGGGE